MDPVIEMVAWTAGIVITMFTGVWVFRGCQITYRDDPRPPRRKRPTLDELLKACDELDEELRNLGKTTPIRVEGCRCPSSRCEKCRTPEPVGLSGIEWSGPCPRPPERS